MSFKANDCQQLSFDDSFMIITEAGYEEAAGRDGGAL